MLQKTKRQLDKKFIAREQAIKIQREALPECSAGIRNIHKDNLQAANQKIGKIRGMIKQMEHILKDYPDLQESVIGIIYQEFAELMIYLEFLKTGKLPKLEVPEKDFLGGLGDAIGELKRYAMELLAKGKIKEAEEMHDKLEDLYFQFSSLNYPSAMVPNLKRKQDVARKVLTELHAQIMNYKINIKK